MLAHGKLASPFVHYNRHAAPKSKTSHVGGAGPNANSRKAPTPARQALNGPSREAVEALINSQSHRASAKRRRDTKTTLDHMMSIAKDLMQKSKAHPENATALVWAAQGIISEIARRTQNTLDNDVDVLA